MIKFLDLKLQYESIKDEIDAAIRDVIATSSFVGGPYIRTFEGEFAEWTGVENCIGVANGTDALEIAIEALDLPSGSEIIVPANSFIASSEAVTRNGHRVVFADISPEHYTLTPDTIRAKLTSATRAVMPVHLYGHPCEMGPILELASSAGLRVIEDCAQAHGAKYKGKKVGGFGDVATFSFFPGKNLGAYGDAGAIVTNNRSLAERMRMIANHGRTGKYDHQFEGRSSRLDGIQAAILSVKLRHLDKWTAKRIEVADSYIEELSGLAGLTLPKRQEWAVQVYHLFVVRTEKRDQLAAYLAEQGISTGVHYPIALPKLAAYNHLGQGQEVMFANLADESLLSLPIGEHMTTDDVKLVASAVRSFFDSKRGL
ncbi:DegT/DnrJ/EryC1/StrS family aminotransferase [Mesorhizobium retamae]|uniref:DegT/DnrJ/EryC1/StrS family aminotransferase n=1 Tax=Mesorhizobium retamae TaxID=2912854 RepID=A0ABS9QL40_9HYPH|nr:DegT/DnrJ/EryC1/StrS family aminotransferase [Mesorhizobium sp. IRAMC:0171]MCG7508156.1 DegT/DnrJ/EryC1/StrS family aminotransferase [Mesorhizobium sp. IRAMC:0171]